MLAVMNTTQTYRRVPVPLKTHGGKSYLAEAILARMPRHRHYVEPFAGGLAVLLARDPDDPRLWWGDDGDSRGVSEVVNDLDGRLMGFWRVVRDNTVLFPAFLRMCQATPLGRAVWEEAGGLLDDPDPVRSAWAFFVRCRQSLAGRRKAFTPLTRGRTRRGMNGNVSEWLSAVDGLEAVHDRLLRVVMECVPAVDLIRREDTPATLFYVDPPYVHGTRTAPAAYNDFEMSDAGHAELLAVLKGCRGKVMLSGYANALYDDALAGWTRHPFDVPNNAAGGRSKRRMTEVLWCNF